MNQIKRLYIIFFLFLFSGMEARLSGQDIIEINNLRLRHFQLKDGLTTHMAERIYEDSQGIIWIGTYNGLLRYDGYEFKNVIDGKIGAILEDRDGYIWVGTQEDLWRYDPRTNQKTSFYYKEQHPPERWYDIVSLAQDRTGSICVGTAYNCLVRLVPDGKDNYDIFRYPCTKNGRIPRPTNSNSITDTLAGNWLWNFVTAENGTTWIGTMSGMSELIIPDGSNPQTISFRYTKPSFAPYNKIAPLTINHITRGNKGKLWIVAHYLDNDQLNKNIIFHFDPESRTFIAYTHELQNEIKFRYLLEDQHGNLWNGPYADGLQFISVHDIDSIDVHHRHITNYKKYPFTQPGDVAMATSNVQGFLEDQFGTIWILSNFMGVFQIPVQLNIFEDVSLPKAAINEKNEVSKILGHNSDFWVSTWSNGLFRYNTQLELIHHFKEGDSPSFPNVIPSIFNDSKNRLWATSDQLSIHLFDSVRNKFETYPLLPEVSKNIPFHFLTEVSEDKNGNFWIGSGGAGLFLFDPQSKKVLRHFRVGGQSNDEVHSNVIIDLVCDDQGITWAGSPYQGLARIEEQPDGNYTFERFLTGTPLIGEMIIDSKSRFWITTFAHGLILFDRGKKTVIKTYSTANGLPNNNIYGIAEDANGLIWLSTPTGIVQLNPEDDAIQLFDQGYGLNFSQKVPNGVHINKTNQLLFGGNGSFYRFDLNSERSEQDLRLKIILNELKINNEIQSVGATNSVLDSSLQYMNNLVLNHNQNNLEFSFSGIQFDDPDNINYSYILENHIPVWQEIGKERIVRMPNVNPGNYIFKVRATHGTSVAERQLHIEILPPIWLRWWAKIVYILLGIGAIAAYVIVKRNMRIKRMELEKISELQKMRSRFFANISHEFRTPLTLIKGPLEEQIRKASPKSEKKELRMMHKQTNRMLQLVDELLDLSKIDRDKLVLEMKSGDIFSFLKDCIQPFKTLAQNGEINFEVSMPDNGNILLFDSKNLEKIVVNLLSNAFKFANPKGHIRLDATYNHQNNNLTIVVTNDGIPIQESQLPYIFDHFYQASNAQLKGSGVGLALVKELAVLMSGSIDVTSTQETGTIFTVRLPLSEASSSNIPNSESSSNELPFIGLSPQVKAIPSDIIKQEKGAHILIVEDNEELRTYIRKLLTPGYHISEAENGATGLQKAKNEMPDLIISDVMMPEIDGIDLCHRIKTDPLTNHIPVILLTAKVAQESRIKGLSSGADDYLNKPFSPRELKLRVGNFLQHRENLKKRFSQHIQLPMSDIPITSVEQQFLEKTLQSVKEHLDDPDFSVEVFSASMNLSRTHFHKKLKSITGQSPSEFIRNLRLQRAAELIKGNQDTISQIAYSVGFNNLSYFTKCFKQKYKLPPSEFLIHHNHSDS